MARRGPRYLLVEANRGHGRWVFPKGHIEDGETAADTALREVAEEAGVRAATIRRLRRVEQKQDGRPIAIAYFLMAYVGRARPLEKRRTRWLPFDDAVEALELEKSRRVLRSADRFIARTAAERIRRAAARLTRRFVRGTLALLPRRRAGRGRRSTRRSRRRRDSLRDGRQARR
jgi:ADP-ribose pyrophosphatase YjhB (NUDIX family)